MPDQALEIPKIISVDDHVVEPAHLWQTWLPEKYKAAGPRSERRGIGSMKHIGGGVYEQTFDENGPQADCWIFEDLVYINKRHVAAVGFDRDDMSMSPITYDEMRPGCYDPKARLEDMDLNWVEASLCFPTMPRFCGQTFTEATDRDLALLCVKAYNDYQVEEWCAGTGGRLIPLIIVPLWDPVLAAEEVYRNAARGVHAVCFSELPNRLGLPSIHDPEGHWDPFFRACDETNMVINMHIGSSSQMPSTSPDAPAAVGSSLTHINAELSMADWLMSGLFERFKNLKVAYSEGQIGWIPYLLHRMDVVWEENRGWGGVADKVPNPPSSYFPGHVFGCFFDDPAGLALIDQIGEDNITYESDYPHSDSTWPLTKQIAEQQMANLTEEQRWKVLRGNAIKLFSLDLPA